MSKREVDNYLASLEEPKRSTLEALRRTIVDVIPEAEQCISYGVPAFRLEGKVIAGFAAFSHKEEAGIRPLGRGYRPFPHQNNEPLDQ
jgi:uncharacterized protein YdhG (YjbR/CyaY superfamily)